MFHQHVRRGVQPGATNGRCAGCQRTLIAVVVAERLARLGIRVYCVRGLAIGAEFVGLRFGQSAGDFCQLSTCIAGRHLRDNTIE